MAGLHTGEDGMGDKQPDAAGLGIGIPCWILGWRIIGGGIGVSVCSLHDKQLVGADAMINHTSSHWEQYDSTGFGDFIPAGTCRYFPEAILCKLYLNKYCKDATIIKALHNILDIQGRLLDYDCAKTAVAINNIISTRLVDSVKSVCVIGDGHAIFSSLWKYLYPKSKVTMINLKKILPYDKLQGNKISSDFCYVEAEQSDHLFNSDIDLFVNIASMQEMNYDVIEYYFSMMHSSNGMKLFYCVNRASKQLPDSSVIEFDKYPWKSNDGIIIDRVAMWYRWYPSKYPPFFKPFDGEIKEKFVLLDK